VAEVKDKEPNPNSESDPKNIENIHIINADPTTTVVTKKNQLEELVDPEEGECLFYS
jgi:hypothetical protein